MQLIGTVSEGAHAAVNGRDGKAGRIHAIRSVLVGGAGHHRSAAITEVPVPAHDLARRL